MSPKRSSTSLCEIPAFKLEITTEFPRAFDRPLEFDVRGIGGAWAIITVGATG